MNNAQEQLNRMKAMMTYGLQTENKNNFSSLEYNRLGADGKMYGIVREGTKYYIKVSNDSKNLIKENFEYIGGFRNRKDNEYTSYANALKHFDLNMRSLNEAKGNGTKKFIAESWNPEKQEFVMVEATQKMKDEIARQRQIMSNATIIFEGKDGSCSCDDCSCGKGDKCKPTVGKGVKTGNAEKANGTGFEEDVPTHIEDLVDGSTYPQIGGKKNLKCSKSRKPIMSEADHGTLAWHKTGGDAQETMADDYMDMSHGTKIGKGSPFDGCPKGDAKREMHNGTVEEGTSMAMDCGDNQNNPKPGVNKIGDDAPFNKKVKNGLHEAEEGEEPMSDDPSIGSDAPMGGDDTNNAPMGGDDMDSDPMGGDDMDSDPMGGDDMDSDPMGGDDMDSDPSLEDDDMDLEGDDMDNDADLEDSDETNEIASLRQELDSLKDLIATVAEKIGVSSESIADTEFNDDSLYPDDDEDLDDDEDFGDDEDLDDDEDFGDDEDLDDDENFDDEDDLGFDDEDDFDSEDMSDDEDFDDDEDDDTQVYESRSYRRMKRLNEDRLDYFGKHPAYRKVPFSLPKNGEDKNAHGRDWNDDSVHGEQPYGEKIGSGAPFEVDPEELTNSIAESIKRYLRK